MENKIYNELDEIDEFEISIWDFYAANLSPKTRKNYYNIVKNYIKIIGKTPLKLTEEDADKYTRYLIERVQNQRLSYTTAVMRVSVMRSLCDYIKLYQNRHHMEYINYFNNIMLPDIDKTLTEEYLPDAKDINTLLEYVRDCDDEMSYVLFALVTKCGLKSSELCNLSYEHIVFDNDKNMCIKFPPKRGVTRIIAVPDDIRELITHFIGRNSISTGPLFYNKHNKQLKVRDAERLLKKYIDECSLLPENVRIKKAFTLQQLRHAAVKYMLQGGASDEQAARYCGITTKWMSRYIQIVDNSKVINAVNMSVISINEYTQKN